MRKQSLIWAIVAVLLVSSAQGFIAATQQGWSKCFYSDVSPDKTLDVRFGFPRRERENCLMKLRIDFLKTFNQTKVPPKLLYEAQFRCFQMNPREPHVYKHNTLEQEFSGTYRICVQNLQDSNTNNNTMFELQIAQKFDPGLYIDMGDSDLPLVQSSELLEVEGMIMQIRRILSWCQKHVKDAQDKGDTLQKLIDSAYNTTTTVTYIQIGFLALYGIFWLLAVRSLYESK